MRLGILDQSPISTNQEAQDALAASVKLAQAGEEFGYVRYIGLLNTMICQALLVRHQK